MSGLGESAEVEENGFSMSNIASDFLSESFSGEDGTSGSSMHCQDTMDLLSDQGDLLSSVGFMDSLCSDGPAKAAYVNGSTSPHISDEILLDISKNVPGFLPKSLHAQNSVTADSQFEAAYPLKKEGEITIRQTLTAEDVENRGIWGFDTDSPENSLDNYNEDSELGWNPQREFMKFLWDDDNGLGIERKLSPVQVPVVHKRKRKDKLVLKVDPSEDPYSGLNFEPSVDHQDEGSQAKLSPVKNAHSSRKPSKLQTPIAKTTKYLNGAAESVKHLFSKQAKKPVTKTQKCRLLKKTVALDLCKGESRVFPRNSGFAHKSQGHIDVPSNTDTTSSNHIGVVHKDKQKKIQDSKNELQQCKDEGKNAKLQCPQCTFVTNCSNTFVLHAKTHEKDKRLYTCNLCEFVEKTALALKQHLLLKHGGSDTDHNVWKSNRFQESKISKSPCSRKTENKIGNHVEASNKLQFDEEKESKHSCSGKKDSPQKEQESSISKVLSACVKQKSRLAKTPIKLLSQNKDNTLLSKRLLQKEKIVQGESRRKRSELQSAEHITHKEFPNNLLSCGATISGSGTNSTTTMCLKLSPKEGNTKRTFKSNITILLSENDGTTNCTSPSLEKTALKSPSKRKLSTPFHNMQGQDILLDFPKSRQNFKKQASPKRRKLRDSSHDLGSVECKTNKNANACLLKIPSKESHGASTGHLERKQTSQGMFSDEDKEISASSSPVVLGSTSNVKADLKSCPYCSAKFESGISLSNHIRGHLHREGIKVRRPRGSGLNKASPGGQQTPAKVKSAEEETPEAHYPGELETNCGQKELICPLCREVFHNRKGISNHCRGHLKRLGKPTSTLSKSPVIILKELMHNKKEFRLKLQILEKKCRRLKSMHRIRLRNGLTFPTTVRRQKDDREQTNRIEMSKGSPPSDLIGILKKRRAHEEAKGKHPNHSARKALGSSAGKDCPHEMQPCKTMANSLEEKCEHNKKVCGQCNFPGCINLSNHLKANGQRKRRAVQDGTALDCKQRKQRSRSGSNKKMCSLPHTTEEVYRLTCRFCDLVFQGPLSVQEDWIKHLQRHIMNTAVPRTGAGMVEVTSFPKDFCMNSVAHAQPSVMQSSS